MLCLFSSSYLHVQIWSLTMNSLRNSTVVELLWKLFQRSQGRSHSVITRTKPTSKATVCITPNAGPSITHVTTIKLIIWWSHVLSRTFFKHNFSALRTSIIRKKCVAVTGDIPMNNHPVSGSTALNCQLKIWWGWACRLLHRQHRWAVENPTSPLASLRLRWGKPRICFRSWVKRVAPRLLIVMLLVARFKKKNRFNR